MFSSTQITSIEPLGQGDVWDFEVPETGNYVCSSLVSHNSGKSVSASAAIASAATGIPITGADGVEIPYQYRTDREDPFVIWCIGYGVDHIGSPIYRLLFRGGAFKIIRDKITNEWRSWRPWEPEDAAREQEARPAPPFIPRRFIKHIGWERKSQNVFSIITLENNTEIYAFTSNSDPKQGDKVDLIWIDEDIEYPDFVEEWQARISDSRGRLIWSAFPHSKNEALTKMSKRAELEVEQGVEKPDIHETVIAFSDNPFIPPDEKRKRLKAWADSPDTIRARDQGSYLVDNVLIYPTYSKHIHCTPAESIDLDDDVDRCMRARNGVPPSDWTRYLVLDPGHVRPAILLGAVPPPDMGDALVIYDEVAATRVDAMQLALLALPKVRGQFFEAFLVDPNAGRMTPMGYGHTVSTQYSRAFEELGCRSRMSGSSFILASDNVAAGIGAVRGMLTLSARGKPRLRVYLPSCPSLNRQMEAYRKKFIDKRLVVDEPEKRQTSDFVDCLRYLAAYNPTWVPLEKAHAEGSSAYRRFQLMKNRRVKQEESTGVHMGPGSIKH